MECCKHPLRRKRAYEATNPLQSIISVIHRSGESMLWCKPLIHVDSYATESLNPSSAIECLIVETSEAEPSTVVHDKDWSLTNLGRLKRLSEGDSDHIHCQRLLPVPLHFLLSLLVYGGAARSRQLSGFRDQSWLCIFQNGYKSYHIELRGRRRRAVRKSRLASGRKASGPVRLPLMHQADISGLLTLAQRNCQ
jgi:hypothetical protein